MVNTLKGKFSLVYLFLVILIAVVGTVGALNLYSLSMAIDGLMTDNYKSIDAVTNMFGSLELQNSAILTYIYEDRQKGIDMFSENGNKFQTWYNIACNNITEPGEKNYTDSINNNYPIYMKYFSELQEARNAGGLARAEDFYNQKMLPLYLKIKSDLKEISTLNETAMFKGRDNAAKKTQQSIYFVTLISIISVAGGFMLSVFFVGRFLKPLHILKNMIRQVKEGHLNLEANVSSKDELGELAVEFNDMTRRLQQYDRSTLGKLMLEKNKSLAIVKSIFEPLIVLDVNYKIVLMNNACEELFNVNEGKAMNKHFWEVIKNGELYDEILNIINSKEEPKGKIVDIQSKGKNYYFNIVVAPVRDINSNLTGIVVTFQNVTELKLLEITKTDFISTISHEFKTPLTSIMMGASLLANENLGHTNEKQANIISTIKEDSERLSVLVNDLLELSRIESGKSVFNIEPCSISDIIETSLKPLINQAEARSIFIHFDKIEELPKIDADFEKITWVLNNLITNALKYTDAGDEIRISAHPGEGRMFVSVSDTGTGIPEEYHKKIFEKFVQVKGHDLEVRGSGLGLAIVKEIVEAHGGEIWCRSEIDSGSTFTFTLPLSTGHFGGRHI